MGKINLNGFFEKKKKQILDQVYVDINYREQTIHIWDKYPKIQQLREMELIQMKELHRKISNIMEEI